MHLDRTPEQEEMLVHGGVLSLVLGEHPIQLTMREVALEIGSERAAVDAVRSLTAIGLVRQEGESVLPTRAALHFNRVMA